MSTTKVQPLEISTPAKKPCDLPINPKGEWKSSCALFCLFLVFFGPGIYLLTQKKPETDPDTGDVKDDGEGSIDYYALGACLCAISAVIIVWMISRLFFKNGCDNGMQRVIQNMPILLATILILITNIIILGIDKSKNIHVYSSAAVSTGVAATIFVVTCVNIYEKKNMFEKLGRKANENLTKINNLGKKIKN